ncbi:hypothetical protein M231_03912 [Tremella mesenterica]|uniref:Short-chain dehydrogenase n=1 Tax=Tremella mesenterica TaxID=5217 RepID=A0A4Q1BM18_TREME|nr:uncharacterized protein TREMEDRAFT_62905 [Tremella mesenterica DSM 1558]EIW69181.1 hypothetical protein TREMEDRAFT_62905 [Tremella mesenterica DSM 1558]RXK38856.1 hypothetical protein M231_03912 [Tremella mesenterica]
MSFSKTILITGGSSGLGLRTAIELANSQSGSLIVVASRTPPPEPLPANVRFVALDLASRESVRSFVASWDFGPISAFICNAGMITAGAPKFADNGIQLDFAVNFVNQALLFFLLKDKKLFSSACRFVFVTTALHDPKAPMNFTPPHWVSAESVAKGTDKPLLNAGIRYSTTKLANLLFSYALVDKLRETASSDARGWSVIAFEPGYMPTGGSQLVRHQPAALRFVGKYIIPRLLFIFKWAGVTVSTPTEAGKVLASIASNEVYTDMTGKYVLLHKEKPSSVESYDKEKQNDLWRWTVDNVALDAAEKQRFETF